ncbi:hypothetical protein [Pseudomonas putida]|nr:hypothetical protein [Pseudomonas putida]
MWQSSATKSHPDEPDFDEDYAAFKAWLAQQGLELKQWHMDSDTRTG